MLNIYERKTLDDLMGKALLYDNIRNRLLHQRHTLWLSKQGFSQQTLTWLQTIHADSLPELAQAILSNK